MCEFRSGGNKNANNNFKLERSLLISNWEVRTDESKSNNNNDNNNNNNNKTLLSFFQKNFQNDDLFQIKRCIKFDSREQTNNHNNDNRERELMIVIVGRIIMITIMTMVLWIHSLIRSHAILFTHAKFETCRWIWTSKGKFGKQTICSLRRQDVDQILQSSFELQLH